MIIIDGQHSGGQTLRTSLSLSALTKKPFKIINIRGKREKSGLQHQHLTAVNAIAKICNARIKGNQLHSHELEFIPSEVIPCAYQFDIGTAGSTTLVLQALLLPLIFSSKPSTIEIKGGTANPLAPPAFDIKEVFLYYLNKIGIHVNLEIKREGFFPKGNGLINIKINPADRIKEFDLGKRENMIETNVYAVSSSSLRERNVSKRLIKGFKLNFPLNYKVNYHEMYAETLSPGCYIHANASFSNCRLGCTILGEKSKISENIGKECALKLLKEINSDATVDSFTADQLLIYMALNGAGKIITSEITEHTKTNMEIIKKFLDIDFSVNNNMIICSKK